MEQRPLEKLCKETLSTKITLEPLGLKHLKTVHEYASDLENTRYMVHLPNETIEETKAFLERKEAEIGWIINKKYWRKGYAFEAANLLVGFCKMELNIHRFIAVCDTQNTSSYRIMENLE